MRALIVLFLLLPTLSHGAAAPYVPPELEPWVDWVLHNHSNQACPRNLNSGAPEHCAWVNELTITVAQELTFEQQVRVYARTRVPVPGSPSLRPVSVTLDGEPAALLGGAPALLLEPGSYRITGVLQWGRRPSSVPIPAQFGLLRLTVDGKREIRPQVRNGSLFLGKRTSPKPTALKAQDALNVDVYRLFHDTYPLSMNTSLRLTVAGRSRLVTLGRVLLDGFAVTAFTAGLPARLDAAGNLQVQVEPGKHMIEVSARALGDPAQIAPAVSTDNWPEQEIWGFQPERQRRLVTLAGGTPIDLEQANAPFRGNGIQGYVLGKDDVLTLTVDQRGNPNPTPNQFNVARVLWLDFDGDAFVVRDTLQAQIRQASRLAATYPLGRIDVDGESELVNTLNGGAPGIELQTGNYQVEAVSRLTRDADLLATGWALDANSLQLTLNLPPGWRLLWASGADSARGSWLAQWRLWDVFVLVFAGVLAWRFLSPGFAIVLVATLGLTLQAAGSLSLLWLISIGLVAAARYIDHARVGPWLRAGAWAWLSLTALVTISFAVSEARSALYPQLETGVAYSGAINNEALDYAAAADSSVSPTAMTLEKELGSRDEMRASLGKNRALRTGRERPFTTSQVRPKYGDNMQIQTGPGIPNWQWRSLSLQWRGPVAGSQALDLALASPFWVRLGSALAALLSLGVTGLLALGLWRGRDPELPGTLQRLPTAVVPGVLLPLLWPALMGTALFSCLAAPSAGAAAVSPEILSELERRLTAPPPCFPNCASIEEAIVTTTASTLTLDLTVHSGALLGLPLPTSTAWAPDRVLLDGEPATLGRTDATALLALPAGSHRVQLRGPLTDLEQMELAFPLPAAAIRLRLSSGWQATGLVEGRLARGTLSLTRPRQRDSEARSASDAAGRSLQPDPAPPFVNIRRTLRFGLEWEMHTQVSRRAPTQGSFSTVVDLLPGEAVLANTLNVRDGAARLVFGPRDQRFSWQSRLEPTTTLTLKAPPATDRSVEWLLEPSNLWHLSYAGLNPISGGNHRGPLFQPQAGESLELTLTATEPLPGATTTVDQITHAIEPGSRLRSHRLTLQLRATQGGNFPITLPAPPEGDNTLTGVQINNAETPIPLVDRIVDLPVVPGTSRYVVSWTAAAPLATVFRTPRPTLASPANNIATEVRFPRDRWVLLLGGPTLGPAMLFWGLLAVVLVLALGIARIPDIPLTRTDLILLALGLALNNLPATLLVAAWILLLRARRPVFEHSTSNGLRNAAQALTALLSIATLLTLIATVPGALLGSPDMQIRGNGSSAYTYLWYSDHSAEALPGAWVVSLPMWLYRGAMLAWCLWLAFALIRWAQWAWREWSTPRMWYRADPADRPAFDTEPEAPQQP